MASPVQRSVEKRLWFEQSDDSEEARMPDHSAQLKRIHIMNMNSLNTFNQLLSEYYQNKMHERVHRMIDSQFLDLDELGDSPIISLQLRIFHTN